MSRGLALCWLVATWGAVGLASPAAGQTPKVDPLANDARLDVTVTFAEPTIGLQLLFARLGQRSDDKRAAAARKAGRPLASGEELTGKLRTEGDSFQTWTLGLACADTPIRDLLRAVERSSPYFIWERRGEALVLRRRKDPKERDLLLTGMARTEQQKQSQRDGRELVAGIQRLSPDLRRAAFAGEGQGSGVPVSALPAAVQQAAARFFESRQQARLPDPDLSRPAPPTPLAPEAWVRVQSSDFQGVRLYQITVTQSNGSVGSTVFEPPTGPPPPDEMAVDPAVVAQEKEERAEWLRKDARFAQRLSLRIERLTLVPALHKLSAAGRIAVVSQPADVRDDPHDVDLAGKTLREAIDTLKVVYGFDWERTREGVLLVTNAQAYRPETLARERAADDMINQYASLTPDQAKALDPAGKGMAYADLPAGLQDAVGGYVRSDPTFRGDLDRATVWLSVTGQDDRFTVRLKYQYTEPGHGTTSSASTFSVRRK